ncbi:MAG: PAS domain S-box protein [Desulfomonilaceae bacterium]|jgi:PAS domain S-box-containing protein
MEEKKPAIGGVPFENGLSFDVASLLDEDPTLPDSVEMRELQAAALAKLLDAMPIPAVLIDPLSLIVFANQSFRRTILQPEKLQGLSLSTLFPDKRVFTKIQHLTEEVLTTGKSQVVYAPFEVTDQRIWGHLRFQSMRLGNNKWMALLMEDLSSEKTQLLSSHRDYYGVQKEIVERGCADKSLFENQQRLELSLRGAELALWNVDLQKDTVLVDQTWADIFGDRPEGIQLGASFWWSLIHPNDRSRVSNAWNEHVEGTTERFECEHRIRNKFGEWEWLLTRGKTVERLQDGKPLRVSGVAFAVTDRKCAEEKQFQASKVFMDAIDPIFIRDLKGDIIDLNRKAEQTYGWSRAELIGKSMKTIVPPDLHSRAEELHERCKRGDKVENVEAAHVTKSGVTIPVLLSLSLLTNERAEPVGIATITKDLSDLKRTEEVLRAQTKALERSNKDLEEFAYVAAHDLREPLIGIATYIKLLERRLKRRLDAQADKLIARALHTITRMDHLIQSLLWYSRLASEKKRFAPTDCNVTLEEALSSLRSAIEQRGAIVESESLPTVMANPSLLIQVFQNLVSNAIRFAGNERLKIRIGARREEGEWKFFVEDNGIGIEPPYLDRIFRIFERIDSSPDSPGTGIGLANCKKIVEHHGGRIWVESKPGKGSTFFFTMPHQMVSDT